MSLIKSPANLKKKPQQTSFRINKLLCSLCHQLIEHILAKDFSTKWPCVWQSRRGNRVVHGFQHHAKDYFQKLDATYGIGSCPLCQIILESMWNKNSPHPFSGNRKAELPQWDYVWVYVESDKPDYVNTDAIFAHLGQVLDWKNQGYLLQSSLLDFLERDGTGSHAVTGEYILPELPKGAPFAEIRRWVDDCVNHRRGHDKCERKKPVLPTRVIDVWSNPPKVVVSNGKSDKYVALSHCWGGLIETRLLHETYSAFTSKGIPEERLPPTFRDAIFVTRQLNIRWIWIDALCIIQDDANDWKHEAERMSEVYTQAVFVLSAYSTPGSKAGLGFRRATCVASLQGGEEIHVQRGFIDQYDTFDPLGSRGWCLQEHVLAFAVLSIGRGHIEWTCPAGFYSEKDPELLITDRSGTVLNLVTIDQSIKSQERAWRHVVTNYTARSLTFEGDKMVALAGVAQSFEAGLPQFAHSSPMTYIAGLWKETFLKDLMWATNPYNTITPRRERAPSWSWVALDGPVTWTLLDGLDKAQHFLPHGPGKARNFHRFCDVDFETLKPSHTDKAARTMSGQVNLSGLLVFLTKLPIRRPDVRSVDLSLREKVVRDDSFFDESLKTALLGAPGSSTRIRRDMYGSIDRDTEAPCWALRLAGAQTTASQYDTIFMMLEEVQEDVGAISKQAFRRVGMLLVSTGCEPVTPIPQISDDPYVGMWSGEVAKVAII